MDECVFLAPLLHLGMDIYSIVCQLNCLIAKQQSRWFQTCFMFTPTSWEDSRFDYGNIFQIGWLVGFNHQRRFLSNPCHRGNNCCITTLATEDGQGSGIPDDENQMTRWWFQIFLMFTPKIGEMIQFDGYFSTGLVQPPTRWWRKCWSGVSSCSWHGYDSLYIRKKPMNGYHANHGGIDVSPW